MKYQEQTPKFVIPHPHQHHLNCEHLKIQHNGHVDYLHNANLHY